MKRILIILLCGLLLTTTACNTSEPPAENDPTQSNSTTTQPTEASTELPDDTPIDAPTDAPTDIPTDTPTDNSTPSDSTPPTDNTDQPNDSDQPDKIYHESGDHYRYWYNYQTRQSEYKILNNDSRVVLHEYHDSPVEIIEQGQIVAIYKETPYAEYECLFFHTTANIFSTPAYYLDCRLDYESGYLFRIKRDETGTHGVVHNAFYPTIGYREIALDNHYVQEVYFSHNKKAVTLRYQNETIGRRCITTIFLDSSLALITKKDCYIRTDPWISSKTLIQNNAGFDTAVLRAQTSDVICLLDPTPIQGGEYESDGVTRFDWYRVSYNTTICYVTADSFDVAYYHEPTGKILKLVTPDPKYLGDWITSDNSGATLSISALSEEGLEAYLISDQGGSKKLVGQVCDTCVLILDDNSWYSYLLFTEDTIFFYFNDYDNNAVRIYKFGAKVDPT